MIYWYYFWTAFFVVAVASFAMIAFVVAIRGTADLRDLLAKLREHATEDPAARR